MNLGLPQDMSSPLAGESYHGTSRSKIAYLCQLWRQSMLLVASLLNRQYSLGVSFRISTSLLELMILSMLGDNTTAIQFTKDPKFHQKTNQMKRCYHFVRQAIKTKEIAIKYIPTKKMIGDPSTKLIPRDVISS